MKLVSESTMTQGPHICNTGSSVFFNSLRFTGSSAGGTTGVAVFWVISSSAFSSLPHFRCVSVRLSPLHQLGASCVSSMSTGLHLAFLRLPPVLLFSPFSSSSVSCGSRGRVRGSAASAISAIVVFGFCGVSTTARRFSSDQLCSTSRRTLRAFTISSDQMLICEVALAKQHGRFPSVSQLQCGIPRSLSHFWKVGKHNFAELQHLSTIRSSLCLVRRRLHHRFP